MRAIIENWASVTSKLPNRIRPENYQKMDQLEAAPKSSLLVLASSNFQDLELVPVAKSLRKEKGPQ